MLGTIVNTLAIICGSLLGLLIGKSLKDKYKEIVMQGIPLSVIFIGASMTIGNMLNKDANPLLFIISLVIGGLLGEWIDIENWLNRLGQLLERKFAKGDNPIAIGFVTASLIYCVGTMAILGSLQSGINGNHTLLYTKSILDGVSSIILTTTLGIGVLFSGFSVLIYQGIITLFASFLEPYMTVAVIREITIVGGILIFSIGTNLLKITKIKTGNLLPAILIPPLYYLILSFF